MRVAGRPSFCHWLNHMKVRHYLGCFHMCMLACGGGRGGADFAVLDSVCGGRRYIISMAEGWSFGGAAGGRKGPRKRCIFPKSDALLDIGVLTREKKGEKRCESDASLGMHHFVQKIGPKGAAREAPRGRVSELILAAKTARKCGGSRLVVC